MGCRLMRAVSRQSRARFPCRPTDYLMLAGEYAHDIMDDAGSSSCVTEYFLPTVYFPF